jgi:hypothetical protein
MLPDAGNRCPLRGLGDAVINLQHAGVRNANSPTGVQGTERCVNSS